VIALTSVTNTPNGFKPKTINTSLDSIPLLIPQTRGVDFYPSALEKGLRGERALKIAIAEMYVQGVSIRKVTAVMEKMCGFNVTSSQLSRAVKELNAEVAAWRQRPLQEITYLILDAKYEKVRHDGSLISYAVLSAVGIAPSGHRTVLGVSVSLREAEIHWRDFVAS